MSKKLLTPIPYSAQIDLMQLATAGLHGNVLKWTKSFLLDRRFEIGLAPSAVELTTKRGVPQGSVLSPILFNVLMATPDSPSRPS